MNQSETGVHAMDGQIMGVFALEMVGGTAPDHAALRRRLRSADIPRWEP